MVAFGCVSLSVNPSELNDLKLESQESHKFDIFVIWPESNTHTHTHKHTYSHTHTHTHKHTHSHTHTQTNTHTRRLKVTGWVEYAYNGSNN